MMHDLFVTLIRNTLATTMAAALVMLFLRRHRRSWILHRIAAVMVLAQGWLFFSWGVSLPIDFGAEANTEIPIVTRSADVAAVAVAPTTSTTAMTGTRLPREVQLSWLAFIWVTGAVFVAVSYSWRYVAVIRRLPIGRDLSDSQWIAEWQCAVADAAVHNRPQCRVTDTFGPALCFIPFRYVIFVPEPLWRSLDPGERLAILRHELTHLLRWDLWKSIAVRILAFTPHQGVSGQRTDRHAQGRDILQ